MRSQRGGLYVLGALGLAAVVLIAVELAAGAIHYGKVAADRPCVSRLTYPGSGLDATVQRIVLDGLDGAACSLGTTREKLVLSLSGNGQIRWSRATIERAVRNGLLKAIDRAQSRGDVGSFTAFLLRQAVERAPIDTLLRGGGLG